MCLWGERMGALGSAEESQMRNVESCPALQTLQTPVIAYRNG